MTLINEPKWLCAVIHETNINYSKTFFNEKIIMLQSLTLTEWVLYDYYHLINSSSLLDVTDSNFHMGFNLELAAWNVHYQPSDLSHSHVIITQKFYYFNL